MGFVCMCVWVWDASDWTEDSNTTLTSFPILNSNTIPSTLGEQINQNKKKNSNRTQIPNPCSNTKTDAKNITLHCKCIILTACTNRLVKYFFYFVFGPPVLKMPICTQVLGQSASRVLWFTPRLFVEAMATPTPLRYSHMSTLLVFLFCFIFATQRPFLFYICWTWSTFDKV